MKKILVLVLIVFLALELYSFWIVAGLIGWLVAIWLSIVIAVVGFSLLKNATAQLKSGAMPGMMPSGSKYLFTAILLIIPGYFSDVLALLALLPFVRRWGQNILLTLTAKKFGLDPAMMKAMSGMGNMGGMNNNMNGMFGGAGSEDIMKMFEQMTGGMGANGMENGNQGRHRVSSSDDDIIECEADGEGYRAKGKDD